MAIKANQYLYDHESELKYLTEHLKIAVELFFSQTPIDHLNEICAGAEFGAPKLGRKLRIFISALNNIDEEAKKGANSKLFYAIFPQLIYAIHELMYVLMVQVLVNPGQIRHLSPSPIFPSDVALNLSREADLVKNKQQRDFILDIFSGLHLKRWLKIKAGNPNNRKLRNNQEEVAKVQEVIQLLREKNLDEQEITLKVVSGALTLIKEKNKQEFIKYGKRRALALGDKKSADTLSKKMKRCGETSFKALVKRTINKK